MSNYIIFALNNNKKLVKEVTKSLNAELGKVYKTKFADGEILVKSASDVKDKDVVIIQSTSKDVNEELFSLLLLLDSIKRCSPNSIQLFMPYFAYSRQERVSWTNEPVSCEVCAKIIDTATFDRLVCFDMHHPIIETFFQHKVVNKPTTKLFADYYKKYFSEHNINTSNVVIISPDHGANHRADMLAKALGNIKTVILDKVRKRPNCAEHLEIDGSQVKDKTCIIIDDIIDTAGTIASATELLLSKGASNVLVAATHPVFSHDSYKRLMNANVADIVVTNSIEKKLKSNIRVLDLLPLVLEELK